MKLKLNRIKDPVEAMVLGVLFLVSLYFFVEAFKFKLSDKQFPMATSFVTMFCIGLYFVRKLAAASKETDGGEKEKTEDASGANKKTIITVVCFVVYIVITYLFGFLVSSAALALAFPLIFKYKKVWVIIACFVWNVGVVLLFQKALGIPLCRGILLDLSFLFFR
jgi:uncharacterized membrane protein